MTHVPLAFLDQQAVSIRDMPVVVAKIEAALDRCDLRRLAIRYVRWGALFARLLPQAEERHVSTTRRARY